MGDFEPATTITLVEGPVPQIVRMVDGMGARAWRVILDVPWKLHGLHVGTFETFEEALRYVGVRDTGDRHAHEHAHRDLARTTHTHDHDHAQQAHRHEH